MYGHFKVWTRGEVGLSLYNTCCVQGEHDLTKYVMHLKRVIACNHYVCLLLPGCPCVPPQNAMPNGPGACEVTSAGQGPASVAPRESELSAGLIYGVTHPDSTVAIEEGWQLQKHSLLLWNHVSVFWLYFLVISNKLDCTRAVCALFLVLLQILCHFPVGILESSSPTIVVLHDSEWLFIYRPWGVYKDLHNGFVCGLFLIPLCLY